MPEDRLRKLNDENKILATHLRNEFVALQKPAKTSMSTATKKKTVGSDLSSTRGSEERHASLPTTGRGQKRGRDNDIEKASNPISLDQRRSSSRKRRKTSKAESPPPPPSRRTKGKAKAELPPVHPETTGKGKATAPTSETETSTSPLPSQEKTAECKVASPFDYRLARIPPEESSFYERFSLDASKLKSSKPPTVPKKSSAKQDSDESQLSSIRGSPQDPNPGNANGRKQDLEAGQNSRSERAKARHADKSHPHGTKMTTAGIPLDDTPADLVSSVKKKRQRVKNIDNKVKFTNKPTQQQEETFNMRPAIHINVPDHLKSILVDDWENVTKNLSLVPLPSKPSANEILTSYFDEEKNKRHLGSPEADLLEEVVAGLKEYFEKCVGRILLYRFERQQYLEVYNAVQAGTGEYEGKGMADIYGAEHLCRLFGTSLPSPITHPFFPTDTSIPKYTSPTLQRRADNSSSVSLPELIAQTNMDQQSVNRLREELHKLTQWLGKNSTRFFTAPYENASQEYIEKVRGV